MAQSGGNANSCDVDEEEETLARQDCRREDAVVQDSCITLGTDFSGMDMPAFALSQLDLPYQIVFGSECNKDARKFLDANFGSSHVASDVCERVPPPQGVTCYVAGFPCQPFSGLGRREGVHDRDGRGLMVDHCVHYIRTSRPLSFVLENVRRLATHDGGKLLAWLLDVLSCDGAYNVRTEVVNTCHHGVPQSRSRLYIVGGFDQPASLGLCFSSAGCGC